MKTNLDATQALLGPARQGAPGGGRPDDSAQPGPSWGSPPPAHRDFLLPPPCELAFSLTAAGMASLALAWLTSAPGRAGINPCDYALKPGLLAPALVPWGMPVTHEETRPKGL